MISLYRTGLLLSARRYLFAFIISVSMLAITACQHVPTDRTTSPLSLPVPKPDSFNDSYLKAALVTIDTYDQETNLFRERAINTSGDSLNLTLLVAGIIGLIASAFKSLQEMKPKLKKSILVSVIIILLITLGAIASLFATAYLKPESERFYERNQHKYTGLANDISRYINDFNRNFYNVGYDDDKMKDEKIRESFDALFKSTLDNIDKAKSEYYSKYEIEVNLVPRPRLP